MSSAASVAREAELDALIDRDPASVAGHILKAECRLAAGDRELARLLFETGLRLAARRVLTADEAGLVERAEAALAGLRHTFHAEREQRLRSRGLPPEAWSPRLAQSLEIAAGQRRKYVQRPTAFDYAGLPQIQFYDPEEFGWTAAAEAAAPAIREELLGLMDRGDEEFRAYIQQSAVPLEGNRALLGKKDWSVLPLCENGWVIPDVVRRCPRTWQAVLQAPVPRVSGWGPTILFSLLKSGAHIAPHHGMFNTRLICHLPLIVPPGCRFRVGNEVREWQEGKLLIFDDSIEHEAWNDGPSDRVVLIFDIWRPELSERERQELTALFSD